MEQPPPGVGPRREGTGAPAPGRESRVAAVLFAPRDIASLAVFRVMFGAMMAFSLTRFAAQGWIELVLVEPSFFFKYRAFPWTVVWDPPGLYAHFTVTALAAICVSIGLWYRTAIVVFLLGFTYIQLLDVTLYLNHYYLVVLLAGLMLFMPLNAAWSVDARRRPHIRRSTLPAWMLYVLRFQVAVVYFYAALAKAQPDWLLYAQPLSLWLRARTETPIIGPLFGELWVAYAMSWIGFLYDLTIWLFLLWRPARPWAYLVVLAFHGMTAVLFEIGMFPIIMTVATTLFFDPDWPRVAARRLRRVLRYPEAEDPVAPVSSARAADGRWSLGRRITATGLAVFAVVQLILPLRHFLYPGDVLWDEQGMRYSWKVMVREKNGSITYRVTQRKTGRTFEVSPFDYLTWRQFSDMSGQPDLIVQLGQHIAWDFRQRGFGDVEVRVDAWVSLNGRAPARIIDPEVDISRVAIDWKPAPWIRPLPDGPPVRLKNHPGRLR